MNTERTKGWCFRLRFNLPTTARLGSTAPEWVVQDDDDAFVVLRSPGGIQPLNEANCAALTGYGYATEGDATEGGERWRDWMTVALACANVGVDFGDRAGSGGFTTYGLRAATDSAGRSVFNDIHGLMTYEYVPRPLFARAGAVGLRITPPHARLADALDRAIKASVRLTPRQRLAYDLYGASFSESNADARFLMLMMAVETLIEPASRSADSVALVNDLITTVRDSGLSEREIASMTGALKWLRSESIGQAGRRLAVQLGDRQYGGESPEGFFNSCYDLRSKLVHGASPRPARDAVGRRAANLEHFVSHLLGDVVLASS